MAYFAVVTADGGVPIFQQSTGEIKSKLPFATVGALNGIHMYSRLQDAELKRAITPEEKILWREYHKRLVLILITKNDSFHDCHMSNLLDNMFAAIAMIIGFDLILKQGEVMRLQKALTECLTKFLHVADSLYGCLLIKGKVIVASKEWWTLTSQEKVLLCAYVNCLPKVLSRESVIFLPTSSPHSTNRLVTLHLLRDVEVCVLCSAEPPLSVLEDEAPKVWRECFDVLKVIANLHPRNIPSTFQFDENIQSLLLINTETNQSVCSFIPLKPDPSESSETTKVPNLQEQQEAIRTLYKLVIGTYFKNKNPNMDPKLRADNTCPIFDYGEIEFKNSEPQEFYMSLKENKCYVLQQSNFHLYIVFNAKIPTFALRPISHKTLKLLTEKRLFPQT
ncbi:protein fuzzy homolog isoform X2 [Parasteatoda tepidariorum]|uniref:protein fuzzy homolog isoform X2 n=1 Tax=Parasteatoda tepidariorum TaxID=114398 RepID=UPI001C719B14|nr:protein fuzzy homolog isoform X2 [Parasteatoda tepidariorum]